ncbi:MAG: DUF1292 domain-containing protein [Tissierellia bacterium]|jgi:uncharacterized protein YrzB (UPF0473 family)|nr:DUF1292 domain-containing protein [Bacillota bacterium]NLK57817.1 DUF1292 domain-containing protein [Tissierellia bacterium]
MSQEHNHTAHDHDCGCDHPHDHNHEHEEYDTIILTLDDDSELECIVLDVFEVDEKAYIALVSIEEEQVLIYRYLEVEGGEEDEFTLDTIDDEEEFELVSQAFNELFIEEIDEEEWESVDGNEPEEN